MESKISILVTLKVLELYKKIPPHLPSVSIRASTYLPGICFNNKADGTDILYIISNEIIVIISTHKY